jgi:hypothetical protein
MKPFSIKPLYLLLFVSILLLTACEKSGPVQHHYTTSIGCLITNDFYATYFSVYVEPEDIENEKNEVIFKSFCNAIPRTGTAYFTADLVDEDLRVMPIGLHLVEQELVGEDENNPRSFKDVRVVSSVLPKLYPQGTIEMQAELDKNGYYALYLNIGGEDAVFEDDKLKIPMYVGSVPSAQRVWDFIRDLAEFLMTFIFPILMLTLIMAPFLPIKQWIRSVQNFSWRKKSFS